MSVVHDILPVRAWGGEDNLQSQKYNLMVVASLSTATNILDILVLLYRIFETSVKLLKNYIK